MGQHVESRSIEGEQLRKFTRCLLNDLNALEELHKRDLIEKNIRRIGVEQEMVLVDKSWRPSPTAQDILSKIDDKDFTNEVAQFNLECNMDPLILGEDCLSRIEDTLSQKLSYVRGIAEQFDTDVALVGILPTIRKSDLSLENMTPLERYYALNETLTRMRGGAYELTIKGIDELKLTHENIMLEAANTSFQVHFQVYPEEFAQLYNLSQVAIAPVLAAAVNSPVLGTFRLWRETRIAVFQQSLDTRTAPYQRNLPPRVHFGNKWVNDSVIEIYQEDIARYKVLFAVDTEENPLDIIESGDAPKLEALRLHTGTVYRWNRACYGIMNNIPHLRIENRVIPAGPTIKDEVANAAFWFGLLSGMKLKYDDITKHMEFDAAKDNFYAAARHGLGASFTWTDGKRYSADKIILFELLPIARDGLRASGINSSDISKYLDIIEERVRSQQTGSQWILKSLSSIDEPAPVWEKLHAITAAMIKYQKSEKPVHDWPLAKLEDAGGWEHNYLVVEQYMHTDLITVQPHEPIDLVANFMIWNNVRHVIVEDEQHNILGVVSHRALLRLVGHSIKQEEGTIAPVSSIMATDVISISPDTPTLEAIKLMREKRISCLPVVKDGKLVGSVNEDCFIEITANLLEQKLKE